MIWDIDAKTRPWQSRIITPILALSSSLNITPSKFTFENSLGGAFHLVLALTSAAWTGGVAVRYSINAAIARCITWSFGKPGGKKHTLFRLNQTVHVTMANNSDEQSEAKTPTAVQNLWVLWQTWNSIVDLLPKLLTNSDKTRGKGVRSHHGYHRHTISDQSLHNAGPDLHLLAVHFGKLSIRNSLLCSAHLASISASTRV